MLILGDGNLYTFGYDSRGNLGLNNSGMVILKPTIVPFFANNNLQVSDVSVGHDHMIALTSNISWKENKIIANGDVYTWGNGGASNFLRNLIDPRKNFR